MVGSPQALCQEVIMPAAARKVASQPDRQLLEEPQHLPLLPLFPRRRQRRPLRPQSLLLQKFLHVEWADPKPILLAV